MATLQGITDVCSSAPELGDPPLSTLDCGSSDGKSIQMLAPCCLECSHLALGRHTFKLTLQLMQVLSGFSCCSEEFLGTSSIAQESLVERR